MRHLRHSPSPVSAIQQTNKLLKSSPSPSPSLSEYPHPYNLATHASATSTTDLTSLYQYLADSRALIQPHRIHRQVPSHPSHYTPHLPSNLSKDAKPGKRSDSKDQETTLPTKPKVLLTSYTTQTSTNPTTQQPQTDRSSNPFQNPFSTRTATQRSATRRSPKTTIQSRMNRPCYFVFISSFRSPLFSILFFFSTLYTHSQLSISLPKKRKNSKHMLNVKGKGHNLQDHRSRPGKIHVYKKSELFSLLTRSALSPSACPSPSSSIHLWVGGRMNDRIDRRGLVRRSEREARTDQPHTGVFGPLFL
ncbi:hypothetical protein P168DRAFT_66088 [Aspergillus campestris IBT 28561]|uniref:Uncharacterized protein n=1 Tax=Aspergillus campestris (strain IBT 28561) TaxID=1392248 RepID=A0A2I1CTC8_ASPC2|nr:uncharacterized protein P168DRAFT_66088 [Aspergillus campestris IBT 28561]PKY00867.1 hypothetical protein P168DRAFT_66088 [Aspergillus campestris IBT 28561]